MAALMPSTSPASTVLRMRILPSREVVDRFTFPEQMMNKPRGVSPSTNRIAPAGKTLLWLPVFRACNAGCEKAQKKPGFERLHSLQLSMISRSYGAFMLISAAEVRFCWGEYSDAEACPIPLKWRELDSRARAWAWVSGCELRAAERSSHAALGSSSRSHCM